MKKISLLFIGFVVVCLFPLAWGYARTTIWWSRTNKVLNTTPTQANPIPLGAFVADEMPVVLTELRLIKDRAVGKTTDAPANQAEGLPQLRFKVIGKGRDNVKSLTFALFDFDEQGLLRRVDSWARAVDLTAATGPTEITINLERSLPPQHRQVLAVEHARSGSVTWRAQFPGLGRGANRVSAGLPALVAAVDRTEKALPDDSGGVLCSNGFRKAMLLAQLGDGQSVTSFTCDQNNRSFSFTFNGKDVGQ